MDDAAQIDCKFLDDYIFSTFISRCGVVRTLHLLSFYPFPEPGIFEKNKELCSMLHITYPTLSYLLIWRISHSVQTRMLDSHFHKTAL